MRARELERAARVHNADILHDAIAVCQCDEAVRWRKASAEAYDRLERRGQREAGRRFRDSDIDQAFAVAADTIREVRETIEPSGVRLKGQQ